MASGLVGIEQSSCIDMSVALLREGQRVGMAGGWLGYSTKGV